MRHYLIYNDMHNPHCVISRQARPPVKNARRPVSQRSAIISRLLDLGSILTMPVGVCCRLLAGAPTKSTDLEGAITLDTIDVPMADGII